MHRALGKRQGTGSRGRQGEGFRGRVGCLGHWARGREQREKWHKAQSEGQEFRAGGGKS